MDNKEEDLLEKLKSIKVATERNHPGYLVRDVEHYEKKVKILNEDGKVEEYDLIVVLIKNAETNEGYRLYYLDGKEVPLIELLKNRALLQKIQEVEEETKDNEEKPEKEQDEELKKESLKELEAEKEKDVEEEEKSEDTKKVSKNEMEDEKDTPRNKRKPSHVIEAINPDKAKMDYWQTIKQAFDLPPQVATLAFAYPVSSEDKVDYANITIYMLDKDGYIIDDLKIDDYFEFDTSTGNNPMQDETVRLEEDENNGKVQTEENRTMIRLKAKKDLDSNSYISLEQKNTLGDYNDINAGSKVKGSINNIEKQLETDHVRVWESESEKTIRANAGEYKGREIYEEIQRHKEHNKEEQYVNDLDADGIKETFDCVGKQDWRELATKWGYYKDGRPDEEKAKSIYEEYKYNNPHLSDDELVQEISDDLYDQTPGGRINR